MVIYLIFQDLKWMNKYQVNTNNIEEYKYFDVNFAFSS